MPGRFGREGGGGFREGVGGPTSLRRMGDRARVARISDWLEVPEIVGSEGLSPEVWGSVQETLTDLKIRLPKNYGDVPNGDAFVNTSNDDVRCLFAQAAATHSLMHKFYGPVTSLDKNYGRLNRDLAYVYRGLKRWRYDSSAASFRPALDDDQRYREPDGMELSRPDPAPSTVNARWIEPW